MNSNYNISMSNEEVIVLLQNDAIKFQDLHMAHQVDDAIAKVGLKKDGLNMQYLADKQRGNKDMAMLAISNNANAWLYLTMMLQRDKELAYNTLQQNCSMEVLKEMYGKFVQRDNDITQIIVDKMNNTK